MLSEIKSKIKYWVVPAGMTDIYSKIRTTNLKGRALSCPNSRFKGIYQGKRCFILCNGPSVKKQDLLPLKNEIVFSVSCGYHHKDYLTIQPKYHCLPRLTYSSYLRLQDTVPWFKEMDAKIGTAELFIDAAQETLIKKNNLFPDRKINYIYSGICSDKNRKEIIDISKKIPGIITVPILCIMIAMYMGFKEIYLIGADNDCWKTEEYKYFYEPTVLKGKIECTHADGKLNMPLYELFTGHGKVLKQYSIVHNITRANNISIFNATEGGALEEFERVKFESLF